MPRAIHINKHNLILNNVSTNDYGMRSQGIAISSSQTDVDLSSHMVLGFINYGSNLNQFTITLPGGGTIVNFQTNLRQFYPISIKTITTGLNTDIVVFVKDR